MFECDVVSRVGGRRRVRRATQLINATLGAFAVSRAKRVRRVRRAGGPRMTRRPPHSSSFRSAASRRRRADMPRAGAPTLVGDRRPLSACCDACRAGPTPPAPARLATARPTSSAAGHPATSVRIWAVCLARTNGLVNSRSGRWVSFLQSRGGLARAAHTGLGQRSIGIVLPTMAIAVERDRVSNDQQFHRIMARGWAGVPRARSVARASILTASIGPGPCDRHAGAACARSMPGRHSAPRAGPSRTGSPAADPWVVERRVPAVAGSPRRHPAVFRASPATGVTTVPFHPQVSRTEPLRSPVRSAASSRGHELRGSPPSTIRGRDDWRLCVPSCSARESIQGWDLPLAADGDFCWCSRGLGQRDRQFLKVLLYGRRIQDSQHLVPCADALGQ